MESTWSTQGLQSGLTNRWSISSWNRTFGLIALCVVLFCFCLGSHRALTAHEALLAGTSKQMVLSGDWLVPRIGDRTWLEKPPLPQWIAAACAIVGGGFNEWTMRLPFAIAGILAVLLTVRIATLLFDARVGWLSGIIQASSVYTVMYARLAESDMLLLALFLAAMTTFLEVETRRELLGVGQWKRIRMAFWVLVGVTNLAKGLVFGSALIVFTCGGWLVLKRDWPALRRWFSPLGILLAFGIAVAWPMAVVLSEPAALDLWKRHLLGRAAGSLGYTQPIWYYLTQWPTQLLPWTPFLFVAAPASWKAARRQSGPDRFCWWWFLGQMALLSCSSGKHHHYLIYALPAMSPIMARGLLQTASWIRDSSRSLRPSVWGLSVAAGGIACCGIVLGIWREPYRVEGWCLLPSLGLALLLMAWHLHQRKARLAWGTLLTVIVLGHIYAQTVVMPRVDTSAEDRQFLANVDAYLGPEVILSACGSQEMSLHVFYLQHRVLGVWKSADLAKVWPRGADFYVVARGQAQQELEKLGDVTRVLQSRFTRRERSPEDRFTLFHVTTEGRDNVTERVAAISQHSPPTFD
jgi:4-amino-4-deoxy-L-arabinose transferase-like glycosyltransferase